MRLSGIMRHAARNWDQIFGTYGKSDSGKYCATGAVIQYFREKDMSVKFALHRVVKCPSCARGFEFCSDFLIHLNDDHRMPFGAIADVCENLENDGRLACEY